MLEFVAGAITMGFAVAGLFFLRFWWRTRDWLFLAFCGAFWLLATSQTLLTVGGIEREEQTGLYVLRLIAFVLILVAIVAKNVESRR